MYNISAGRSAGWSGLAFVVLAILSTLLFGGAPPEVASSPATIGSFLIAHRHGLMISAWLGFPTAAVFLWFAVGVRAHLAHSAGLADGLPLYAISAAIATAAIAFGCSAVLATLAIATIPTDDLPGWWALYWLLSGPIISMSIAIFIFATAHSMRRHGSASEGLTLYGYFAGFVAAVSTLALFFRSGPLAPTEWVTFVFGSVAFVIWVIATSIWLIRSPGASAA